MMVKTFAKNGRIAVGNLIADVLLPDEDKMTSIKQSINYIE